MSGTATLGLPSDQFSDAPLSDAEKAHVRRFCGYPAYGAGSSGFQGWRFFQAYGLLEYRIGGDAGLGVANMAPTELAIVRQYLQNLFDLEAAVPAASNNLDTDEAAVWVHNKNEISDRLSLFNVWRRQLCSFIGVPEGPSLASTNNLVQCVV